jgi:Tol biopolymer transport system component
MVVKNDSLRSRFWQRILIRKSTVGKWIRCPFLLNISLLLLITSTACTAQAFLHGLHRLSPTGDQWAPAYAMSWSPSASELAISHNIATGRGLDEGFPEGYIYITDIETKESRVLESTRTEAGQASAPAWSADSKSIAFFTNGADWSPSGIWYVRLDEPSNPVFLGEGEGSSWGPNGDRIAIADAGDKFLVYIVDIDSGERHQVYELVPDKESESITGGGISWSPLGDRLAFAYTQGEIKSSQLIIMELDSRSEIIRMENGIYQFPSWSPDGKQLAFSSGSEIYDQTLTILNIRDGTLRQPLGVTGIGPVAWSPEGWRIAVTWKGAIYAVDVEAATSE